MRRGARTWLLLGAVLAAGWTSLGCGPADTDPVRELPGAVHRFATVRGIRWHWVQMGQGDTVVLLHGMPESWYAWRHQIPVLARRYRVLAFDLKGFGLSDKADGDYSFGAVAEQLAAVLSRAEAPSFRLVGHDWGGIIAARLASRFPERVTCLVHVAAPVDTFDLNRWPDYTEFRQTPGAVASFLRDPDAYVRRYFEHTLYRGAEALSEQELREHAVRLGRRGVARAIGRYFRDLELDARGRMGPSMRPDWQLLSMPVLLIVGGRDLQVPLETSIGLEQRVPGFAGVAVIEGAGHHPHEETPEQFNQVLMEFLADPSRVRRGGPATPEQGSEGPDR